MTYQNQVIWQEIQNYLPENNRIDDKYYPIEEVWNWKNNGIHIDYYPNTSSKTKVILLHGIGGNGRLLSFIGVPLFKNGVEVISPDLPGYGYSITDDKVVDYNMWINLVNDLVDRELKKDNRPIVLFGLSAGGMLAYHAACVNKKVSGIIATNLLDQRIQEVRDHSALNKTMSRIGIYFINLLSRINEGIIIPMRYITNMKAIVNDKRILNLLIKDKTSSGSSVSIRFIHSLLHTKPEIEPEDFDICSVLLLHPENDNWTDVRLSKLFFDRLHCSKVLKMLENAGHFPVESPGLEQLEKYVLEYIERI